MIRSCLFQLYRIQLLLVQMALQIELKFRASLAGYALEEIPILFVERRAGQSKMSGAIVVEAMIRVWHLALQRNAILERLRGRAVASLSASS